MKYHFDTLALHAGYKPEGGDSAFPPVHRTAAFHFRDAEHAKKLFAMEELGNVYTRLTNPTVFVLEERVTALHGALASVAFASGTAAIHAVITNLCSVGSEIVSANNLYGGTYTMFNSILPDFGIKTNFTKLNDFDAVESAVNENTRLIYIEAIGNPALDVADIENYSKIAKKYGIPLVVDSTFTPPAVMNVFDFGADFAVHSLSKWMSGSGQLIGGIVVDGGSFSFKDNPRFPQYNSPDPSFHDMKWAHDLGELNPLAFALRLRMVPLRNLGGCLSPDDAWLTLLGLETLSLRMERHCENSLGLAQFLQAHPKVEWVLYPGLESHPSHDVAKKYLKKGSGSMVVFGVKGGRKAGEEFINHLNLFSHVTTVGTSISLAVHPASTTHSQLSAEEMKSGGLTEDLIRLSIGLEDIEDLKNDLNSALSSV